MDTILQQLIFEIRRIRKISVLKLAIKMLTKAIGFVLGIILLPIAILFHIYGYRHVLIFTDRIGHLALEPDCLLKAQYLGQLNQKKWILLAPVDRTANEHLLTYWKHHFIVIRNRAACFLIRNMSRFFFMRYDAKHFISNIGKSQVAYSIYTAWGERPPIISLTKEDEAWGKERLALLGLPNDAWFVCVHARESGFSPIDEELHHHRNCKIENTFDAIEEIVRRGGWVIRIGDPTMKKLPIMHGVIDYAHHPLKSPRLDIILCALARFILGNTSGIALVGTIFGTPCALANMVPISAMGISPKDISIPKLLWSSNENRYLRFDELFSSKLSNSQYSSIYTRLQIRVEENSKHDILKLSSEMLDQLDGISKVNPINQDSKKSFLNLLEKNHYSYGANSRISSNFLQLHKLLMPNETLPLKNSMLSIHHIGARGPTQAFPQNDIFESSIINILYEADSECIAELENINSNRAAKVIILNECISGSGGIRTFCDAHHGYGSSLLEADPKIKDLYIPAHWIDYDYTVYEAVSAKTRRQVITKTIDEVAVQNPQVPLPDFLSLDTQGSELEILKGSPLALDHVVCIVTEVEFLPLYQNQPLFGDINSFLTERGFVFARFFSILDGSFYRAPIGLRGKGVPITTDALYLRDPRSIITMERPTQEIGISLTKLAFFALIQGYIEHALWALNIAESYAWRELNIQEPWFMLLLKFHKISENFPKIMPVTFKERYVKHSPGKEKFSEQTTNQLAELTSCFADIVALLHAYNLNETAEVLLKQSENDCKRLGHPVFW